jgi:glycosyltransferase involved in cell wall biosynthesis
MGIDPNEVTMYVPARNADRTLAAALDSIAAQTVTPADVIVVVDTRSTDTTRDIAHGSGATVIEQYDGMLGVARNHAIEACRTTWLASCDSDVVLDPTWLERLIDAASRRNDLDRIAAIGGCTEEFSHTDADRWRAVNMPHNWGPAPFDNPFMLVSEMMASVHALRAVGGYRADLFCYEDSDLCQRLRHAGYTLAYEPTAVARHDRRDTVRFALYGRWRLAA